MTVPPVVVPVLLSAVLLAAAVGVGYATYADARERDVDPWGWTIVAVVAAPAAAWYWIRRERYGMRTSAPSARERFARALGLATVASMAASTLVLPPDIGTTAVGVVAGTVLGVPVVYLLLGRSTQPKS
jgi:4-amino-4-deoxy-L-arabinose transferase-like glycosyltransferase